MIALTAIVCAACASSAKQSDLTLTDAERYRADAYTELAFSSLEQGQPETAKQQAERAISITSSSDALHAIALAALALDDTATAGTYFQKALDAQGGNSDAVLLLNYGTFLCNEGQPSEGLALLSRAAKAAPAEASRVQRLSTHCARPPSTEKRGLSTHETRELKRNGFGDE